MQQNNETKAQNFDRNPLKRVLIMAGGTGGHVFPGLAIAKYLRDRDVEVHWLGTSRGLEAQLVPEADIPLHLITIGGLRGKGIKTLLAAPIKIMTAIKEARRVIHEVKPDVVLGLGGFVSGPGGIASWLSHCPLVIHEQNAKAGFTNKILARFAKRVLEGFPNAFAPQAKVIPIGNPIRHEIEALPAPDLRLNRADKEKLRLLVLGGSLGAKALNEMVPQALAHLALADRPNVRHQTGEQHMEGAKKAYQSKEIDVNLTAFIKDMAGAYEWADIVICRAGALTVSELCAAGLGAVLVPFPHAVDDHQTANAQFMVDCHAAYCIQQRELTAEQLADIVRQFAQSPEKRLSMAKAAYSLRKVQVAEKIFDILLDVVKSQH